MCTCLPRSHQYVLTRHLCIHNNMKFEAVLLYDVCNINIIVFAYRVYVLANTTFMHEGNVILLL